MTNDEKVITEAANKLIKSAMIIVGEHISDIINQDGDDVTDAQVVDQIVQYLKNMNIYKPRK